MSQEKNVAKHYKKKQIESATPVQLVVLLYEGAIEYLTRAEQFLAEKGFDRYEKFHNNLIGCQNIITELTVSLDMEKGGAVSENLFRLYEYMNHRLIDANISKDVSILQEVKGLLINLKEAWTEVQKKEGGFRPSEGTPRGINIQG